MESNLGLMLEQSWSLYIGPLMVILMEIMSAYFLEDNCDLLMVK